MASSCGTALFEIASPEDRAHELVRFVVTLSGEEGSESAATALLAPAAQRQFAKFITQVAAACPNIFSHPSDEEVEGYFTLLFSFLKNVPAGDVNSVVTSLSSFVLAGKADRAPLRLRILANLFNILGDVQQKVTLFSQLLAYAAESKQLDVLTPYFPSVASWYSGKLITAQEVRQLYLAISRALTRAGDVESGQAYLIRYLASYEGAEESASPIPEEAKEAATEAALGYIRAPAISQRSALPHLRVVRALADDPRHARLHELVTIFATKDLEAYTAYVAANGEYVASIGLDTEASQQTMRLFTLCSVASARPVLPYDAIASKLKIENSEVESWVVKAITRGLIDARMDQATSTVTVTRTVQREFGSPQWVQLQAKLKAWRDNVSTLLASVEARA